MAGGLSSAGDTASQAHSSEAGPSPPEPLRGSEQGVRVSGTLPQGPSPSSTEQRGSGKGPAGPRFPRRATPGLLPGPREGAQAESHLSGR